ncbi:MAG: TonB-dependent receptor [Gammaproteobacteria bacterium]|nr:TonB-dependent receptor [Gammaproteobacteria bacterium]
MDLGLHWQGERASASAQFFVQDVEDYIERVRLAPEVCSYRNLGSGRIQGIEALVVHAGCG